MKTRLALAAAVLILNGACKTGGSDSALRDDETNPPGGGQQQPPPPPAQNQNANVSAPWAEGVAPGDLKWEVRFNFPPCDHPGKKKGAYCLQEDYIPARDKSGVEGKLATWANDPNVKSLWLAYFSFSNKGVRKMLCEAAKTRPELKINVFLHKQNLGVENVVEMSNCSPANLKVIPRGTEFGNGYLQHAKIFMALETADVKPLHLMDDAERAAAAGTRVRFTSSSANMSSYGTGVHLENWQFWDAVATDNVAQENVCYMFAMQTMKIGQGIDERADMAKINKQCRDGIQGPRREDVVFYPVPHGGLTPQPMQAMKKMMDGAESSIKVAIHRMTTAAIFNPLATKAKQGKKVSVLFDDDTLRMGKCNGGAALDVGAHDVNAARELAKAGADVTFVETNGALPHLHHNKFMVVDEKIAFTGAGNFTATSLNSSGPGNMEQFYVITVPEIVKAYSTGWDYLKSISTKPSDHETAGNADKPITSGSQGVELGGCN